MLETYPDAELYLCGDGLLREELETQISELGIGASTTFLGHVPYDEMPKVYRSADVLVLPSRAEGVPRTVLEALSSGVRVVSTELRQVQAAVGSNVVYVSTETGRQFAAQIIETLADEQSPDTIGHDFRWEHTIHETTSALTVLGGNGN